MICTLLWSPRYQLAVDLVDRRPTGMSKQLTMQVSTIHRDPTRTHLRAPGESWAERRARTRKLHGRKSASKTGSSESSAQPARSCH